jgi:DNA mismatch endonuclease (patch repair protein)
MQKIERNKIRDMKVNEYYKKIDWLALRIWEHDLKHDFQDVVTKIAEVLNSRNSN